LDGGGFGEFREVCVEPPLSVLNTTLRAFAAERRRVQCAAAIDRHLLPIQQQTRRPPLLLPIDGRNVTQTLLRMVSGQRQ